MHTWERRFAGQWWTDTRRFKKGRADYAHIEHVGKVGLSENNSDSVER